MERSNEHLQQPNFVNPTARDIYFTIIRPSLVEFFGVFFLTFGLYAPYAITAYIQDKFEPHQQPPSGGGKDALASIVVVFLYIGIYSVTRVISGGHLNPIITLVQVARRTTIPVVGLAYLVAQLLGGVLGALSVEAITTVKPDSASFKPFVGTGHAIFAEMMGTAVVILAYLTLANQGKGNTAILGIGFGYAGALLAVRTATMGYLNPVLNFGVAVASKTWTKHYVYWVGTGLGGIVATLLHGLIFAKEDELWVTPRIMSERLASL